jgi:hypothetical protein
MTSSDAAFCGGHRSFKLRRDLLRDVIPISLCSSLNTKGQSSVPICEYLSTQKHQNAAGERTSQSPKKPSRPAHSSQRTSESRKSVRGSRLAVSFRQRVRRRILAARLHIGRRCRRRPEVRGRSQSCGRLWRLRESNVSKRWAAENTSNSRCLFPWHGVTVKT